MGLLRRLLGGPKVPVRWARPYKGEPGELEVFCLDGWQYTLVTDKDVLDIARWLDEHPNTKAFDLMVGDGMIKQRVRVDEYAMPFFRAVMEAVAQEIKAEPVPLVEVQDGAEATR